MLLAIDTSNDFAGVALWDAQGPHAEATWHAGRQHTEQVLPQIDLLLRQVGVAADAVEVIAVATGPGSWSGLRAGMSLAKALAIGRDRPIIGIPTLDALAFGQRVAGVPVLAVVRLGRDRYGVATYGDGPAGWGRTSPFQIVSGAELWAFAPGSCLIGDLPPSDAEQTAGTPEIALPTAHQRRAIFVAELAWTRHQQRSYDDRVALEPIYLGSPIRPKGTEAG